MPSAPVVSVRTPCIDGLVIVMVTPGITAPLLSVIFPLMAPVVVLTVWPSAAATDPKTSTRTNTGTWQCSRLMRLLRDRNTQRPRDRTPSGERNYAISNGHYTRFGGNAIAFHPVAGVRSDRVRDLGCLRMRVSAAGSRASSNRRRRGRRPERTFRPTGRARGNVPSLARTTASRRRRRGGGEGAGQLRAGARAFQASDSSHHRP